MRFGHLTLDIDKRENLEIKKVAIQSFLTRSEPFGTINIKEKTRGLLSMHHMRYRAGLRVTYKDTVPNKNSIILFF